MIMLANSSLQYLLIKVIHSSISIYLELIFVATCTIYSIFTLFKLCFGLHQLPREISAPLSPPVSVQYGTGLVVYSGFLKKNENNAFKVDDYLWVCTYKGLILYTVHKDIWAIVNIKISSYKNKPKSLKLQIYCTSMFSVDFVFTCQAMCHTWGVSSLKHLHRQVMGIKCQNVVICLSE